MNTLLDFSSAVVVAINNPRQLLESLGTVEGMRTLERSTSRLQRVVDSHHGKIIDDSGWTMTALFPEVGQAADAARAMCQRIAQLPPVANQRVTISVGAALTPEKALALVERAPIDSVLICSEIEAALAAPIQEDANQVPEVEPTAIETPPTFDRTIVGGSLILRQGSQVVVLDDLHRQVTVGRSPECGVRVNVPMASRVHATIMKDGNYFSLIDTSTNGTFLTHQDGSAIAIRKHVHFLKGQGRFALGQWPDDAGENAPSFEVVLT